MLKNNQEIYRQFKPELTPKQMLELGVFGGAYFIGVENLIPDDIPETWFRGVRISHDHEKHKEYNFFGVSASQSLSVWQKNGWIYSDDPHGWFQWYCRYYLGRRIPQEDARHKNIQNTACHSKRNKQHEDEFQK